MKAEGKGVGPKKGGQGRVDEAKGMRPRAGMGAKGQVMGPKE